jgi:peptidoglycan/LPS O-acetylase OafA/YrhL
MQPQAAGSGSGGSRRLASIDGLRGLAILLVLFAHVIPGSLPDKAPQAMLTRLLERFYGSGVELFCLISGLVSLRPFLRRLKPFNLNNYVKRRVQRLWPPYFVTLALLAGPMIWLMTAYPTYFSASLPFKQFRWSDWFSQLFIINWGTPLYIPAWWFLSIEMVFYALVPLLAILASRRQVSKGAVWGILAISFVVGEIASRVLSPEFIGDGFLRLIVLFGSYMPCHAAGMAAGQLDLSRRAGLVLVGAGLATNIVWSWIPVFNNHLGNALFFMGLAALALLAGTRVQRFLEHYFMIWVGERSYSIFLIHAGALMLGSYLASLTFMEGSLGYYGFSRCIGLPLGLLAAMLLFTVVERRFARGLVTGNDFFPFGLYNRTQDQPLSMSSRISS